MAHNLRQPSGCLSAESSAALFKGRFAFDGHRTVLRERFHQAPLKVSKTFHWDDGELAVYLQDVSPGMLGGDRYMIDVTLGAKCSVYLTNQSFTRVHPTPGSAAELKQMFYLEENSVLEYFPEPLLPYAGSRFQAHSRFQLENGATLMFGEVISPGRISRGEQFQYDLLSSRMEVYKSGRLLGWDHFRLEPAIDRFNEVGAFDKYTHMGTLWVFSEQVNEALLAEVRSLANQLMQPTGSKSAFGNGNNGSSHGKSRDSGGDHNGGVHGGIHLSKNDLSGGDHGRPELLLGASLTHEEGLAVRLLGNNSWKIQEAIKLLWDCCRLHLLGKPPLLERK